MRTLIRQAYALGTRPRVHGNGFVQLDLSQTVRLHIWGHDAIPKQTAPTPIHNHMFGFTSLILRGIMMHCPYHAIAWNETTSDTTHMAYRARVRKDEDTVLESTGVEWVMRGLPIEHYGPGTSYAMEPGQIHESMVMQPTATVICKQGRTLAQGGSSPTIYVPLGVTPDNDFDRYALPAGQLWDIIWDVMS